MVAHERAAVGGSVNCFALGDPFLFVHIDTCGTVAHPSTVCQGMPLRLRLIYDRLL